MTGETLELIKAINEILKSIKEVVILLSSTKGATVRAVEIAQRWDAAPRWRRAFLWLGLKVVSLRIDRRKLRDCYHALKERLSGQHGIDDLCRVVLVKLMDAVARVHGGLLLEEHRAKLSELLGLGVRVSLECKKETCYNPRTCLLAYLMCRKWWMVEKLRKIAIRAGPPYAETAKALLGEKTVLEFCEPLPAVCAEIFV